MSSVVIVDDSDPSVVYSEGWVTAGVSAEYDGYAKLCHEQSKRELTPSSSVALLTVSAT